MQYEELVFKDVDGNLVVIMKSAIELLQSHRQFDFESKEAGGVLIGERRGSHLVICDISEPGEGDTRHRFSINRKGPHHQAKVDVAFSLSNGTQQYIGEWHTHPEDIPSPSFTDKFSWLRYISSQKPMVVLIVGREQVWLAKKIGNRLFPMSLA
ncbi:putative metal-dependent protease of the PAD1/JAB1 superfamily [Vibrio ichthyoenteri ATCC 700023]|uniref:Putative metal-dependent protease of the PAD1/JAB1 superfamily n=1 Tax=Vibrio ichthyoenteri ATCC 700023 TaxID=870968 RepID=F9S238_9VIBR|nr:Mov34/MPN/PAD-1 family protein [Vibrio ichthyoenteri]EGU40157.1 putative metal-dependent protease of the PAD1/JAB1 superfamily [Vibrio ichthyoenteri ATCC 700023]